MFTEQGFCLAYMQNSCAVETTVLRCAGTKWRDQMDTPRRALLNASEHRALKRKVFCRFDVGAIEASQPLRHGKHADANGVFHFSSRVRLHRQPSLYRARREGKIIVFVSFDFFSGVSRVRPSTAIPLGNQ